jgi:hypothetical protein
MVMGLVTVQRERRCRNAFAAIARRSFLFSLRMSAP